MADRQGQQIANEGMVVLVVVVDHRFVGPDAEKSATMAPTASALNVADFGTSTWRTQYWVGLGADFVLALEGANVEAAPCGLRIENRQPNVGERLRRNQRAAASVNAETVDCVGKGIVPHQHQLAGGQADESRRMPLRCPRAGCARPC